MQGFAYIIRKKRIVFDVTPKRGIPQQIRTEIEAPAFSLIGGAVGGIAENLPRSDEYERIFLIVVFSAAVFQIIGASYVFQKNDINPEILSAVRYRACDL